MDSKVQEIIDKELRKKTGVLDFYNCPLQDWPEQIFEMTWLKVLNMSANYRWHERKKEFQQEKIAQDQSINHISNQLGLLTTLEYLCIADHSISKIEGLDKLNSLNSLYLNSNSISKIEGLDKLNSLNLF